MKKLKGVMVFVLVFISTLMFCSAKSYAAEVRYTDNVIPAMTSDTSPSGTASASSVYSSFQAWKAFDKNYSGINGWVSTTSNGWLEYDFVNAKCITKYVIVSRAESLNGEWPKSWTFEAWDAETSSWKVLDSRTNIIDWSSSSRKEFTFTNSSLYKKYRINVTENCNSVYGAMIGELEMMETIPSPTTLSVSVDNSNADLSWTSVTNAQSYKLKRSTTPGGPYTTIATGSAISFTDEGLQPGIYYYVVSTVISSMESTNSNEVSVTISEIPSNPGHEGNYSTLILSMTNGDDKEYPLSIENLDSFLTWYDYRSKGTGKAYYIFNKKANIAPYVSVKDYISFDKISSFEVKEYNQ